MSNSNTTLRTLQPSTQAAGVTGLAIAGIVIFAGNYHLAHGENGGLVPAIITAAGCLLLAALLYGAVLPRTRASNRAAVVLGILAVVSLPAFWSGVTPILASTALAATSSSTASRAARIAQGAALLAAILALTATLTSSHLL